MQVPPPRVTIHDSNCKVQVSVPKISSEVSASAGVHCVNLDQADPSSSLHAKVVWTPTRHNHHEKVNICGRVTGEASSSLNMRVICH